MADKPVSKVDIVAAASRGLTALAAAAAAQGEHMLSDGAVPYFLPVSSDGWDGKFNDPESLHQPFDRTDLSNAFERVVKLDRQGGGVIGDLPLLQLQGDLLAVMERSFRSRHQTYLQSLAHSGGRLRGHGQPTGVFLDGIMGYLTSLSQKSKQPTPR